MEAIDIRQKICSFCGEEIPESQRRCPYCGSLLEARINEYKIDPVHISREQMNPEQMSSTKVYSAETSQPLNSTNTYSEQASRQINSANTYNVPGRQQYSMVNPAQAYKGFNTNNHMNSTAKPKPLSNGLKVFLTVFFVIVPGIGQLAGAITAIILMNSDLDHDRRSFGVALLVASLLVFVLVCAASFIIALALPMLVAGQ